MTDKVLVTGASGALGRGLVQVLVNRESVDAIYALVHSTDVEHWPSGVTALRGDIRSPGLGLPQETCAEVQRQATLIIHAAADTRFSGELSKLRAVNVDGTRNILDFSAACPRLRGVAALSTVHVAGKRTGTIAESSLTHEAGFVNHYEHSKYEAELILRSKMKDLPISVIRLSTVLGDSLTGEVNKLAAIHQGLRLYYHSLAPMIPGAPNCPIDLIAADFAARAIVGFACDKFSAGRTFHLCGGQDFYTLEHLLEITHEAFIKYRPAWRKRSISVPAIVDQPTFELFAKSVDEVGDHMLRHSVHVIRHFAPQLAYPKVFDDTGSHEVWTSLGIRKPHLADFYPKVIQWLVESGWTERATATEAMAN